MPKEDTYNKAAKIMLDLQKLLDQYGVILSSCDPQNSNKEPLPTLLNRALELFADLERYAKEEPFILINNNSVVTGLNQLSFKVAYEQKKQKHGLINEAISLRSAVLSLYHIFRNSISSGDKINVNLVDLAIGDISFGLTLDCLTAKKIDIAQQHLYVCKKIFGKLPNIPANYHFFRDYYMAEALVFGARGLHKKARASLAIALSHDENLNESRTSLKLARACMQLAVINTSLKRYAQAIRFYERANNILVTRIKTFASSPDPANHPLSHMFKIDYEKAVVDETKLLYQNESIIAILKQKLLEQNFLAISESLVNVKLEIIASKHGQYEISLGVTSSEIRTSIRELLKKYKIDFRCHDDKLIIDGTEITAKMLRRVWSDVQAKKNQVVIATPQPNVCENTKAPDTTIPAAAQLPTALSLTSGNTEKAEKEQRHQLKDADRAAKKTEVVEAKSEPVLPIIAKSKSVKWKDERFPEMDLASKDNPYIRIHGRREIKTFAFFPSEVFEEVPTAVIEKKIKRVAKEGRVYGSKSSKGCEGFVFYKEDKVLGKYGSGYSCKLKIFGSQGAGNMRLIGKKVTTGIQVKGSKISQCELYVFDKFVPGH